MSNDNQLAKSMSNIKQIESAWAHSKGRFWVPTGTADRLPAGIYAVGTSDRIGVYVDLMNIVKDDLVVLPGMGAEAVLTEIAMFMEKRDAYKARGIVHKRGIIMEGPPGSGKTSNSELLVELFINKFDGIVMVGQDASHMMVGLDLIRDREPDRPIMVLMEDIDGFRGDESALLNLLDGKNQHDRVVFVATTNYIEKLPDRIANRPSRFDLVVKIPLPSAEARDHYLKHVEPAMPDEKRAEIVAASNDYSVAHLKELLLLTEVYGVSVKDADVRIRAIMARKLLPEQAAIKTQKDNTDFGIQPEPKDKGAILAEAAKSTSKFVPAAAAE